MEKKQYDGMMLFNVPIMVSENPEDEELLIVLGLLYSTSESETNPEWLVSLEIYSCYLLGIEYLVSEGGRIVNEDTWMTSDGKSHFIGTKEKQKEIYLKLRKDLKYKLYEFSQPVQYEECEVDGRCILSPSVLDRCGVSFIENLNIKK